MRRILHRRDDLSLTTAVLLTPKIYKVVGEF